MSTDLKVPWISWLSLFFRPLFFLLCQQQTAARGGGPLARKVRSLTSSPPQQWFFDIPVVTRFLFVASFVVSLAGAYGAVSAYRLTLAWPLIIHNFEL